MSYHGVLSKRSLILIKLRQAPATRIKLAKELGYSATQGISRELNKLIEDGMITEDSKFRCPHCSNVIEGIPLKKDGKMLRLTPMGESQSKQAREQLQALLGASQ